MAIPDLSHFGRRIMICGTSSTGKSTLAVAIGRKLDLPVVHLDQLRFVPGSDWVERPDAEFHALHRDAIAGDSWVMDGNYSAIIDARIARATGIILLADRWANLGRYLRRTLFQPERRLGNRGQSRQPEAGDGALGAGRRSAQHRALPHHAAGDRSALRRPVHDA